MFPNLYNNFVESPCTNGDIKCQNGGTCVTMLNGDSMCKCLPGYSGDICQSE